MLSPAQEQRRELCKRITFGYRDPNWPNPYGPSDACIVIYGYVPNIALCILGVVLFAIALVSHVFLVYKHRSWYFSTIIVGTLMEVVGYAARTLSSKSDPYSIPFFVVQYFFIVVAPVMFSAALYTILSVMINRVGRQFAPLPPKAILWIFITCDVVATVVQVLGAGLVGAAYSKDKNPNVPNDVLLAGLGFQVFSFAIFIVFFVRFLQKCWNLTASSFKQFSKAVFIATLAVYLRTCFRLAETAEGLRKFLSTHEVFFGCLEFLPIVVAVYILVYWHPGMWLGSKKTVGKI